ncbi:ribonuclease H-like domain-containing protein [Mycena maculata]|uniref:DNA polymerase delta catalytic subunit n=1 Tax=Mycena maculata TaxID=230809 RepID=A0AAD7K8T7_9AGAR|nr:ribonuclease H-like domain-containing protein [Mycena maculata]
MFGVTQVGHRIIAHITGFLPYLYYPISDEFKAEKLSVLQDRLNTHLATASPSNSVHRIDLIEKRIRSTGKPLPFLKITAITEQSLQKIKDKYILLCSSTLFEDFFSDPECVYESQVDTLLHFMHDCKIMPMGWAEIPPRKYEALSGPKVSYRQPEFAVRYNDIAPHSPPPSDTAWRILSFDIETTVPDNGFPKHTQNAVIQIASMLTRSGEPEPYLRAVFTLGTCSPIPGAEVHECSDEASLLLGWRDLVLDNNPDLVTGYNITRFDLPYLLFRAKHLGLGEFPYLGRIKVAETIPRSLNYSWQDAPMIAGRLLFDVYKYARDHIPQTSGMGSLKLGRLCAEHLGEGKEDDVDFTMNNRLQAGGPEDRCRLAVYCLKDAYLPQRLIDCARLRCLEKTIEAARVSGVPFNIYSIYGPTLPDAWRLKAARDEGRVIRDI